MSDNTTNNNASGNGNVVALREALENIKQEAETTWEYRDYPIAGAPGERGSCPVVDADWIIDTCKTALSKPPRNCDVGTAEEQAKRMDAYCASHGERIGCSWRCDNCPLCSIDRCELVWAQMPYEEGEK